MKKPELTYEEFLAKPMVYHTGLRFDWGAYRTYRNDDLGIQKEVITRQEVVGDIYSGWHAGQVCYYLDGDDRTFTTPDQLYVAYMEQVCNIKEKNT